MSDLGLAVIANVHAKVVCACLVRVFFQWA